MFSIVVLSAFEHSDPLTTTQKKETLNEDVFSIVLLNVFGRFTTLIEMPKMLTTLNENAISDVVVNAFERSADLIEIPQMVNC